MPQYGEATKMLQIGFGLTMNNQKTKPALILAVYIKKT
jgi:hypothetical protein